MLCAYSTGTGRQKWKYPETRISSKEKKSPGAGEGTDDPYGGFEVEGKEGRAGLQGS